MRGQPVGSASSAQWPAQGGCVSGISELMIFGVLVAFMAVAGRRAGGRAGVTLALRRFVIDESARGEALIEIAGRPAGLLGWFLSLVGLTDETCLIVRSDALEHTESSLSGFRTTIVRLADVAAISCGHRKSLWAVLTAAAFLAFGVLAGASANSFGTFLFGLAGAAIFGAMYYVSQTIVLSVQSIGGAVIEVAFKQSLVEGAVADLTRTRQAMQVLNEQVAREKQPLRTRTTAA